MQFVSPEEWGARINYDLWADTQYTKDDIAIHWGGNRQPTWKDGPAAERAILRAWENYHIDGKGWRGIAYGYAVGASGTVYRLRGKNNYGAHSGDHDGDGISNNKETIPIVFIMGENSGPPTAAMWLGARQLYQWLVQQPWTDHNLAVYGHREIQPKPTTCPGDDIMGGIHAGWVQVPPPSSVEERLEELEVEADLSARFREATTRQLAALSARTEANGSALTELEARADALEGAVASLVAVVARLTAGARIMGGQE